MHNISVSSLGLSFGKYLDPMIDTKLTVVAHGTIDNSPEEDDALYIFKHTEDNTYYCCFIPGDPSDSGPKSTPGIMRRWLQNTLSLENLSLDLLKPKSNDWFQYFYLAEIRFTDPGSKLVH